MSPLARYVALSYAGISLVALALVALGTGAGGLVGTIGAALAMFSPLVAAALTQRAAGERPLRGIGARPIFNRWLLVASGLGLAAAALSTACTVALPGIAWDPANAAWLQRLPPDAAAEIQAQLDTLPAPVWLMTIPNAVLMGATVNALFAFGEEIGWRGWLHRHLAPRGFWATAAITGAIWGAWHAPLILLGHNYPDHRVAGAFLFVGVCVLLSPLHTLVRARGGSAWHAAVLHGTFNAGAGLPLLVASGGNDLLLGPAGLGGVLGLLALNLLALPWTLTTRLTAP